MFAFKMLVHSGVRGVTYGSEQPISRQPIMLPRQKENSTYMIHMVKKIDSTEKDSSDFFA